jgi:hypothetical protein
MSPMLQESTLYNNLQTFQQRVEVLDLFDQVLAANASVFQANGQKVSER